MNSAQPNNRRIQFIVLAVVAALAAAGLAFGLVKMTGSDSDSDQTDPKPSATAPANQNKPREVILMVKHGEQHALLDLLFYPQGGQVTGKYTLVHFDTEGKPARFPNAQEINGSGTPSGFTLNGLGDYGPVQGNALDPTHIHFDQTFGVEEYDWKVITSTDEFDKKVTKFESCLKEHDTTYCETVLKDVN